MARITLNDSAPEGAGTFGFGPETLDVTNGPVDTDNAVIISSAHQHDWLDVEITESQAESPEPAVAGTPEPDEAFTFNYDGDN